MFDSEVISARHVGSQIYVLDVRGHLTTGEMGAALQAIWEHPQWSQPWGLVVKLGQGITYDLSIREHAVPPPNLRAVGTAVVTDKVLYRMVVNSIGVGLKLTHRFDLSAHGTEEQAVGHIERRIVAVQAKNARF